jgi:hypothetical protein
MTACLQLPTYLFFTACNFSRKPYSNAIFRSAVMSVLDDLLRQKAEIEACILDVRALNVKKP